MILRALIVILSASLAIGTSTIRATVQTVSTVASEPVQLLVEVASICVSIAIAGCPKTKKKIKVSMKKSKNSLIFLVNHSRAMEFHRVRPFQGNINLQLTKFIDNKRTKYLVTNITPEVKNKLKNSKTFTFQ